MSGRSPIRRASLFLPGRWFLLASAIALSATASSAGVPVGGSPAAIAANPATNKLYVANSGGGTVSVISGATDSVVATIPVGTPGAIAVNPVTNMIYVADSGGAGVTVISGLTDTVVTTVMVGTAPDAIAVNSLTNTIYVANSGGPSVSVIDGATNTVTATVTTGANPVAIAVNPQTNMVYVANKGSANVTVITGGTNAVAATVGVGTNPVSIAVNPTNNEIFVANNGSNNVTAINGANNTPATFADPNAIGPVAIAVNSTTGSVYIANNTSGNVSVLATNSNTPVTLTDPNASTPIAAAVNAITNTVYVANNGSNNVTVINGATNSLITFKDPGAIQPAAIAVNPVTHQIFAANFGSGTVSVINGSADSTSTVTDGMADRPAAVAVDSLGRAAYVVNANSNNVTVLQAALGNGVPASVIGTLSDPHASHPVAIVLNPITKVAYVANQNSNNVTAFNSTGSPTTLTDPNASAPVAIAANLVANKIYVANSTSNNVTVIDGATNAISTMSDPNALGPAAIAVNPATGKVYVANSASGNVSVFDPFVLSVQTVTDPAAAHPVAIVVNAATNMVYVANSASDNVTVINGLTNQIVATVDADLSPIAIDLNPATNMVYVANSGRNNVTVINGATLQAVATVPAGAAPHAIAVDVATNQIYVANNGNGGVNPGSITDIDGASNTNRNFADPNANGPYALGIDPTQNQVYVANNLSANVTDVSEQTQQANGIGSFNGPTNILNNTTPSGTPAIDFSATSTNGETLDNVFIQIDSWTVPWANAVATSTPGNYVAMPGMLTPGLHIGYAYPTDGEESTSATTGAQSAPGIGNIASYEFLVAPPLADSAPSTLNFGIQQTHSPSAPQAITLANAGGAPLTFSYAFTGTNAADFSEGSGDTCGAAGGQLASGASCTVVVVFNPSAAGSETAALTFTDNSNSIANSIQTVGLSGTGATVPRFTLSVAEVGSGLGTVSSPAIGFSCQPGCSATFNQGAVVTLTATPNAVSVFAGWSGAGCSGTGPCVVTLNASKTVTATFTLNAASACSGTASIWIGGASGTWNNSSNWSTDSIPGGGANVCITNGTGPAQVTLNSSETIGSLYIDPGSSLTIANNNDLDVTGNIYNAGQITVNAGGNGTELSVTGNVTLAGGGTITMTNGNAVIREDGTGTLINVNNTISGSGQIGTNGLTFTNQAGGVVNANSAGLALAVNASGTVRNQGLFEATSGGTLQISVLVINAGATISAGNGSSVQFFNGARIEGGTLTSGTGSTLGTVASTVVLDGSTLGPLTNAAAYTLSNNTDTQILGTINNTGSFNINAGGNGTALSTVAPVTLMGGGTITMTNGNALIRQDLLNSPLTNVDNKIVGSGQITTAMAFTNQAAGVVNANSTGLALSINTGGAVINQGLFEATNGGTLQLSVTVSNANATIISIGSNGTTDSAVQLLNGTRIEGGTISNSLGGTIGTVASTVVLDGSTLGTLNNASTYVLANNTDTQILGTINNTGSFTINAGGNGTALSSVGAVTLTGGGTITMTNGNAFLREDLAGSSLTNVNNTILGSGQIGDNGLTFTNQAGGVVNANSPGLAISINANNPVTNQGLFEATNSGTLQISVLVVNPGATISAGSGAAVQFFNGARIEGGTLTSGAGSTFATVTSTVVLDGSTQGPLTNAAAYTLNNNTDTQILGTINNTGSININAGGNGTALSSVGAVTLTGGGTITMTNGNALIREDVANSSLTNVNNIIVGSGQIGNNGLSFTNGAGAVLDASTGVISINTGGTIINQGLLEATGSGTLQVSVLVINAGATISAGSGAAVQFFNGARIEGGTLAGGTGSTLATIASTVVLDGSTQGPLTNAGVYTLNNNTDTQLLGTINNTGSFNINAGGNGTELSTIGAVTLTGGGTIAMTNGNAILREDIANTSLTNVNNTISGSGQIGTNGLTFTNQAAGVVNASSAGLAMAINASGTVTNKGLLEATGTGSLQISVPIINTGATISAGSGASVQLSNGARIEGGTMAGATGSTFATIASTVVLDGSTQGPLTNATVYTLNNNTDTQILGTINNTGSININAGGNGTELSAVGAVILTGGGTVTMSNGNAVIRQDIAGSSLTNSGNTITGPGQLQVPSFAQTSGFIQIPSGVSDSVTTFVVNGGIAQVDGTLSASNGVGTLGTGFISGTGSIPSNVANTGVIEAGDIPAPGLLTIPSGTYAQTSTGSYEVAIGGLALGTQYSQLHVAGSAVLAGALNVRLINGFVPALGNQFTVLTAGSVSGTFASINSPTLPAGLGWSLTYTATSVVLTATGTSNSFTLTVSEPGNGNGTVTDNLGQIDCVDTAGVVTGTCSASYLSGTIVTLTANPTGGSSFNGWSTCAGTLPCSVAMNGPQAVQATFGAVIPAFTLSLSEMGTGTGSVTDNTGQINCSEANGIRTGTCSATYTSGAAITLTASPTSPSTFGGWGGACSTFGTGTTCNLTVNSSLSASANFIPPPQSQNLTFPTGTNPPVQQAVFDCPSNPNPTPGNPCTDANAHSLQLQIPQVNTSFSVTVTATEIPPSQATGLCTAGDTVANDFSCRFATFFNYGVDGNGNTSVPLCYPYANGNCVHYEVYSGTPGTEPDPSLYSGGVNWQIAWNNDLFTPPAPYTGSQPQLYDDPDYAPTPTSAVGSLCTQPMTINGVPQSYSCQFEFDITTFFNATQPVDSVIGGTTKQLNDVVVAFPPSTAGQLSASSMPDAATVVAGSGIGFTIKVSNAGPGIETNVALNDPLPSGTGVNWSISPAYSGPGTCSIAGALGSQVLSCAFGTLTAGSSATLHVSSAAAGAGTYTNAATVTVNNQQYLTISTVTVQAVATQFSALTASQTIAAGTASITLSGTISGPGPVYPVSGEMVSVTINGTPQSATIGANGGFSLIFPTAGIPASATPYAITYSYAGDANLNPATDSTTTLTANAVVASESLVITTLGTGTGTVTDNLSQITCSTAGGTQSGTCSANYPAGTMVTLTAAPTTPSAFAGWGGACASSGTAATCTLTMNAPLAVTADFVPPPAAQNVTFPVGTNPPPQQAVFDCPSNTNPCTDTNAHSLQLQIPQVGTSFTVTVLAVEVPPSQATGLCKPGDTVANDFNCRFATFFNYGTDANGNTIVPLCYPYANGNCVHYEVYSGTPGTEPDPSLYSGGVNWQIAWNDDKFTPPAPYTGSQPQLYDDPDYAPTPTSAVGSVCTQPMTINGVPQSYSCQFEFVITTFFNATQPVDSVIGGTTKQLNDVVVAFPPNTAGQLGASSTPDAGTVSAGSGIGFTIKVSNAGPGIETNVALNDPLPSGTGVNWSISPAYSGPGTCSIAGAVGSQVLSCAFGTLTAGSSATLHVSSATAGAGTYTNAATITVNNQQYLTISTVTVQATATQFSALSASQTIWFGAASVNLSGTISAPGPVYPASGEMVSITIDGMTHLATIGTNGTFSLAFPTTTIPGSATPYIITYSYAGDSTLTSATNTSTLLSVNLPPAITSAAGTTFVVGAAGSFTVTAIGIPAPRLFESGTLPSGVTFVSATGLLSGTPATGTAGVYPITFAAVDTAGFIASQNFTLTVTNNSNNSSLKISPSSVDFGKVYPFAVALQDVTLTNTGKTPVTITSVGIQPVTGGDSGDFFDLSLCPKTLPAGKSCIVGLILIPTGKYQPTLSATLAIADSAPGSPQSVPLTATEIDPKASLNFNQLSFGTQKVKTTSGAQTITLTNTGESPLTLGTVTITGNFAIAPGTTCTNGAVVAASGSCVVNVTFTPSSKGTRVGALKIADNALLSPQIVVLSGTGN